MGNSHLKVVGISGLSVKWDRKVRRWCPNLREKIGKGKYQIPNHGIDCILLKEKLLPYKYDIFWNHFKGMVFFLGQGYWESRLPGSHNYRSARMMHDRRGTTIGT